MSDPELDELIERLSRAEEEISYRRRVMQGQLDILCAERDARRSESGAHLSTEQLPDILVRTKRL